MSAPALLLATRSSHKVREIREILVDCGADLLSLDERGLQPSPAEDDIECFDSFAANAIAKARYFADMTGSPTVADDSGIVVPALGGEPGVISRRYAQAHGVHADDGDERDAANNQLLLERARTLRDENRRAYYACAVALVIPSRDEPGQPSVHLFAGTCEGRLADSSSGTGGFGYDPVFFVPELGRTFAEVDPALKHRISHRARAFRALASFLPGPLR